jgi:hypothetical protein
LIVVWSDTPATLSTPPLIVVWLAVPLAKTISCPPLLICVLRAAP